MLLLFIRSRLPGNLARRLAQHIGRKVQLMRCHRLRISTPRMPPPLTVAIVWASTSHLAWLLTVARPCRLLDSRLLPLRLRRHQQQQRHRERRPFRRRGVTPSRLCLPKSNRGSFTPERTTSFSSRVSASSSRFTISRRFRWCHLPGCSTRCSTSKRRLEWSASDWPIRCRIWQPRRLPPLAPHPTVLIRDRRWRQRATTTARDEGRRRRRRRAVRRQCATSRQVCLSVANELARPC